MEKVRPWCGPTLASRTSLYVAQSCPRVELTHGLGWVEIFQFVVGWVVSTIAKKLVSKVSA